MRFFSRIKACILSAHIHIINAKISSSGCHAACTSRVKNSMQIVQSLENDKGFGFSKKTDITDELSYLKKIRKIYR